MSVFLHKIMLNTIERFLKMRFFWNDKSNSRNQAKNRLELIIAHDRASINPDIMLAMREEILDVVARYVEVDREEMEFSLSNDRRLTSLTANLPIRQIKRLSNLKENLKTNELPDLPELDFNDTDLETEANARSK